MKNILFKLFTLCAFAFFSQNLQAQAISAADQKGIEECYNVFRSAFEKLDASSIGPWLTENAEQILPNGEIIRGRANIVANMAGFMGFLKTQPKPDRTEIKNANAQTRYLAPDLILYTYTEESTQHFGDKSNTEKMTNAVLLRKVGGKWLAELIALTPMVEMPGAGK